VNYEYLKYVYVFGGHSVFQIQEYALTLQDVCVEQTSTNTGQRLIYFLLSVGRGAGMDV
jgi:hypothetical protein